MVIITLLSLHPVTNTLVSLSLKYLPRKTLSLLEAYYLNASILGNNSVIGPCGVVNSCAKYGDKYHSYIV